jgi:hypothetical protein
VDRDVIGFKIEGAMSLPGQSIPAIPVMPLAILTDPLHPGDTDHCDDKDHDSWEYRILARKGLEDDGKDHFRLNPETGRPEPGNDDIPEIRVTIHLGRDNDKDRDNKHGRNGADKRGKDKGDERGRGHHRENGRLAAVGVKDVAETIRQFRTGITYRDLWDRDGQLVLGDGGDHGSPTNRVELPETTLPPERAKLLAQTLNDILGQPRVWMLYSEAQEQDSPRSLDVVGFVAARVMKVETDSSEDEPTQISVILQPCLMITATAVTDYRRRDLGPRTLFNPYVCKVRLVE